MTVPEHTGDANLRPTWFGLLAVAAIIAGLQALRYWGYVVDDIFITLRYARHLDEGLGLVFNAGERVEGYTNFLHVLLAAACFRFGLPPIVVLKGVAVVAFVWALFIAGRLEQRVVGHDSPPLAPLLLLPLGASIYWAVSPMETMLFAAVAVTALWLLVLEAQADAWRGSALAFVLLSLIRPEGALLFAAATAAFAVGESVARRSPQPLARHGINIALFIVPVGLYTIWRFSYFGQLAPNTFYARFVGGSAQVAAGMAGLGEWIRAQPLLALALLLPLAALVPKLRQHWLSPSAVGCLYVVFVVHVLYAVGIGGDFMPFHRFFVFMLPVVAILAAALVRGIVPASPYRPRIVLALIAAHALWGLATEEPYRALVADRTAVVGERVGVWLAKHLEPTDMIAVNTAGALPYFSNLPAIDMLGLTEPAIAQRPVYVVSPGWTAHRRGWGEYVLQRRPRAIFWYNSAGSRRPHYLSDRELAASPLFRFSYRRERARIHADDRTALVGRFVGTPLGNDGGARVPDLGMRAYASWNPLPQTVFREGEIVAHFFKLDARDENLWASLWEHRDDATALVAAASKHWAAQDGAPGDVQPSAEVRALCDQAHSLIELKQYSEAKQVLADATRRNRSPRSPLVFQYVANLATITGDLFTAIAAQKEALRMAPRNPLYQQNLRGLLSVPYEEAVRPRDDA